MARRKSEAKPPEPPSSEMGEFRIGDPEFRIGVPSSDPAGEFRVGRPAAEPETEFRIRPPAVDPKPEFRLRPPPAKGKKAPELPALPRGWEPVPTQPPWRLPGEQDVPPGELRRLEKPRKRYRGLSAIRAYVDPEHVEEVLDLLVFNARRGEVGPGSVSGFLFEAVEAELERGRVVDEVGARYPTYSADGVRPRRGRRAGSRQEVPPASQTLRPVIARIPTAIADEIRDCVIHRNGGQPDGPNTVSRFVADAIGNHLVARRRRDGVERYSRTAAEEREAHLDPRVLRNR